MSDDIEGSGEQTRIIAGLGRSLLPASSNKLESWLSQGHTKVQSIANYSARSAHENTASSSWLRVKVRIRGTAPMRAAWLALE